MKRQVDEMTIPNKELNLVFQQEQHVSHLQEVRAGLSVIKSLFVACVKCWLTSKSV